MRSFLQDLRHGFRLAAKAPGFALVIVVTLALGIASTVTIVSFMDAMFLRKLPVPNAARLWRVTQAPRNTWTTSYRQYAYFREHAKSFEALAAHYSTAPLYVTWNGRSNEVQGAVVTWNYFPVLGIQPALGRFFTAEEDSVPTRDAVVVISYDFWQARLAGDSSVIGRTLTINSVPFQIIGVAPRDFAGVDMGVAPNQVWIPAMMLPVGYRFCDALRGSVEREGQDTYECSAIQLMGWLRPGVSAREAAAEAEGLRQQAHIPGTFISKVPLVVEPVAGVRPIGRQYFISLTQRLALAAALLLLIACANAGGLMLARGTARMREMATRMALGAGPGRIVRQVLLENLVLALAAGLLGALLADWASSALMSFYTGNRQGGFYIILRTDPVVLWTAVGVSVLTGLLAGVIPALASARTNVASALKLGGATAGGHNRVHAILVTAQITLCLSLLIPSGLLLRSMTHIGSGAGFDPRHVAGFRLRPRLVGYQPEKAQAFTRDVVRKLESLPGVESVAIAAAVGQMWSTGNDMTVSLPGAATADRQQPRVFFHQVSPNFFATLRIPFLKGRDFNDHDRPDTPRVAIVNETLARTVWNTLDVVDRPVILGGVNFQVAGVVKDSVLTSQADGPVPEAFLSFWQNPLGPQADSRVAVRVAGDPAAAYPVLQQAIGEVDPAVPVTETITFSDQVRQNYVDLRLTGTVLSVAGGVSLLLAALGIYGLVAFVVRRSTREIGIRMALGARPAQVTQVFVRRSLMLVSAGAVAGAMLALGGAKLLASMLFGVSSSDPVTFLLAPIVLAVVTLLAGYLPSRAAAKVDPLVALRYE